MSSPGPSSALHQPGFVSQTALPCAVLERRSCHPLYALESQVDSANGVVIFELFPSYGQLLPPWVSCFAFGRKPISVIQVDGSTSARPLALDSARFPSPLHRCIVSDLVRRSSENDTSPLSLNEACRGTPERRGKDCEHAARQGRRRSARGGQTQWKAI